MRNIKGTYYFLAATILIVSVIIALVLVENNDNIIITIVTALSLAIAVLAIGMSDRRLPRFKGKLSLWLVKPSQKRTEIEEEGKDLKVKFSIRIENFTENPINDVRVKIRMPSRIAETIDEKYRYFKVVRHGLTNIFIDDSFGILGTQLENDYLHYDLNIKPGLWTRDNIYVMLSGSNIQTVNWCIKLESKSDLLNGKIELIK
jgi:hypothetical protein